MGVQGIDTIALSRPTNKIVAISVTTSNNIREKIRTMLPQLNRLRNELNNSGVVPAIFSPIDPSDKALRAERQVKIDLAAHAFDPVHAAVHEHRLDASPRIGRVVDILRPDTEDDLSAGPTRERSRRLLGQLKITRFLRKTKPRSGKISGGRGRTSRRGKPSCARASPSPRRISA